MIRFSDLMVVFLLLCSGVMVTIDLVIGLVYLVSVVPLMFFLRITRSRPSFILTPIYTAIIAFIAFCFLRPMVLVADPAVFGYAVLGLPSRMQMMEALVLQGFYATMFLCGLYVVMHVNTGRLRLPPEAFTQTTIGHLGSSFLVLLAGLSVVWLLLIFVAGVAHKGQSSSVEALRLILPVTLIIPVAIAYLSNRHTTPLTGGQKLLVYTIILANILATVFRGSKAGMFLLVLYVLIYWLLMYRNFRMPVTRVILLSSVVVVLLGVSVFAAQVIRNAGLANMPIEVLLTYVLSNPDFLYGLLDLITQRLTGYDGMLAVLMYDPPAFQQVARWDNILLQALGQILPGVNFPGHSVGKSVGIYFEGKTASQQHAGALGLSSMLHYMHGIFIGPLMAMLLGALFGLLFRLADWLCSRGAPERVTAFLMLCHVQASWISSGNFDRLIQYVVIALAHMIFYYAVLRIFLQVVSTPQNRGLNS